MKNNKMKVLAAGLLMACAATQAIRPAEEEKALSQRWRGSQK
jgi:outer membrane biogenesis lipoprotein LolB